MSTKNPSVGSPSSSILKSLYQESWRKDCEALLCIYGDKRHPVPATEGQRPAMRMVSQFGEESTKVLVI
jgi:hypothetical protein